MSLGWRHRGHWSICQAYHNFVCRHVYPHFLVSPTVCPALMIMMNIVNPHTERPRCPETRSSHCIRFGKTFSVGLFYSSPHVSHCLEAELQVELMAPIPLQWHEVIWPNRQCGPLHLSNKRLDWLSLIIIIMFESVFINLKKGLPPDCTHKGVDLLQSWEQEENSRS